MIQPGAIKLPTPYRTADGRRQATVSPRQRMTPSILPTVRRLTVVALTMYTYIMQRTQIYLTKREAAALERAARETGWTRSQLIREAIEARYLTDVDQHDLLAALEASAGLWSDVSETGEVAVERLRTGRLARQHQKR